MWDLPDVRPRPGELVSDGVRVGGVERVNRGRGATDEVMEGGGEVTMEGSRREGANSRGEYILNSS